MIYAMLYNRETEETATRIFYSYEELHRFTFCPIWDYVIIDTERPPAGHTYSEKKNSLHDIAVDFSNSWAADHVDGISWNELSILQDYFTIYGRRYGLLTELRENAII